MNDDTVDISIVDPEPLVELAKTHPLQAANMAQAAWNSLDGGFIKRHRQVVAASYAAAFHLSRNEREWKQFLTPSNWTDFRVKPRNSNKHRRKVLSFVMCFVFGGTDGAARKRALVLTGTLQHYFDNGIQPSEVVELINDKGVEELRRLGVARRRREKRKKDGRRFTDDLFDTPVESSVTHRPHAGVTGSPGYRKMCNRNAAAVIVAFCSIRDLMVETYGSREKADDVLVAVARLVIGPR